ncbi:hypothetical protein GCM10010329_82700 [Streptomyces spiroverticillatus]|uniref:Uncharacterized protein n=1 Tax=Streptomyces finlayi TaxID=67296 RepID=A0A919CGJ1_9ACTN|nr:hypothetical protein [Streptomyces finlayi]GHA47746.1 hypothetical protein GCM10010329_82700 [Streptomyces spiroverticillatus]GHD18707.1 hypothetical protein GCM10010334_81770 [Streptomyces finlayi]
MHSTPLPGTRIRPTDPFPGHDGPAYILLADLPIHVHYTRVNEDGGTFPPAPVDQGLTGRAKPGQHVLNFLNSSLKRMFASEAFVDDAAVIRYRQSARHSVMRFEPDRYAGVLIRHPEQQVNAPAYMVTLPGGDRVLWSRYALLRALEICRRPTPVDWPDGWAHQLPDGSVQFDRGGDPWATPRQHTAAPVTDPGDFGPPCADCQHFASDHTPGPPWARYRRDKQVCTQWRDRPSR